MNFLYNLTSLISYIARSILPNPFECFGISGEVFYEIAIVIMGIISFCLVRCFDQDYYSFVKAVMFFIFYICCWSFLWLCSLFSFVWWWMLILVIVLIVVFNVLKFLNNIL